MAEEMKKDMKDMRGRRAALYGRKADGVQRESEKETEGTETDEMASPDGHMAQRPDPEAHGGGPGAMYERHAMERKDMHMRHERERMAMHGAHRDEHRTMQKAHEAEHSGMYAHA